MQGSGGDPLLSAHDVSDLHHVVVDDVCQVVGRKPIAFKQNRVGRDVAVLASNLSHEDIFKACLAFGGDLQANDWVNPLLFIGSTLFGA